MPVIRLTHSHVFLKNKIYFSIYLQTVGFFGIPNCNFIGSNGTESGTNHKAQ